MTNKYPIKPTKNYNVLFFPSRNNHCPHSRWTGKLSESFESHFPGQSAFVTIWLVVQRSSHADRLKGIHYKTNYPYILMYTLWCVLISAANQQRVAYKADAESPSKHAVAELVVALKNIQAVSEYSLKEMLKTSSVPWNNALHREAECSWCFWADIKVFLLVESFFLLVCLFLLSALRCICEEHLFLSTVHFDCVLPLPTINNHTPILDSDKSEFWDLVGSITVCRVHFIWEKLTN